MTWYCTGKYRLHLTKMFCLYRKELKVRFLTFPNLMTDWLSAMRLHCYSLWDSQMLVALFLDRLIQTRKVMTSNWWNKGRVVYLPVIIWVSFPFFSVGPTFSSDCETTTSTPVALVICDTVRFFPPYTNLLLSLLWSCTEGSALEFCYLFLCCIFKTSFAVLSVLVFILIIWNLNDSY